jgi:hypothetical protein
LLKNIHELKANVLDHLSLSGFFSDEMGGVGFNSMGGGFVFKTWRGGELRFSPTPVKCQVTLSFNIDFFFIAKAVVNESVGGFGRKWIFQKTCQHFVFQILKSKNEK